MYSALLTLLTYSAYVLAAYFLLVTVYARTRVACQRYTIGVFHPYCAAGGGGERVLFSVVQALVKLRPSARILVYTGDSDPATALLAKAKSYFDIDLTGTEIEFVRLRLRGWTEPARYPFLTLLGQFCGSAVLVQEAVIRRPASVMVDTHGHAFGYWFARLAAGTTVLAYVHYPAMSTDMIQRVREMRPSYNNRTRISQSSAISRGKLLYYKLLYHAYSLMGRFVSLAVCNSSWTKAHIEKLWKGTEVMVVYPPCNIRRFAEIPMEREKTNIALSIGQFRPEKDHELQIHAFSLFLQQNPDYATAKLQLVGSSRGADDEFRVSSLQRLAASLHISHAVDFRLNVDFTELRHLLGNAQVGLHTMWNEHFGICVVELMAAGLITVAHASGGPKTDIIREGETGFLAGSPQEYADAIARGFREFDNLLQLRKAARREVGKYSDESFLIAISSAFGRFL